MNRLKIAEDSPVPKVRQIESQIRERIITGDLEAGLKLPSMRDLAEHLGVSVGIAKQALNTLTIEGYLRSDPKVGVFVSNKKPTKDIALVLPSVELEQIPRIVRGARSNLPDNFRLVIEAAANDFDSQIDILKYLNKSHIAGILLMSPPQQRYAEKIRPLLNGDIPCVQILFELSGLPTDSATFDGYEMGFMAVEHLIKSGHSKIGLISTDADASTFINRNKGIDAGLQKIGQSYNDLPKEIIQANKLSADTPSFYGQQATLQLMKKYPDLTAIIGGDGHISLGIVQAVKETGKLIPDDISIISLGVDLSPFAHMTPAITAFDEPLEKICRRATEMLIDRINNPDQVFRAIQFPPLLHNRGSVRIL